MNNNIFTNIKDYYNIIITIISIIIAVIALIYRVKSNFISKITKFINDAQDQDDLTGPEKMDLVVSWIKDIIPRIFSVVFNDKTLNQIAQNIYDDMKQYAKKRNIEIVKKQAEKVAQSINTDNSVKVMPMKEFLNRKLFNDNDTNKNKDEQD